MKNNIVLTIGGFDAEGRKGLSADRSCLLSLGFKPINVVSGIFLEGGKVAAIQATTVERQLKASADFRKIRGIKTGLLATRENVEAVATFFEDHKTTLHNLVVDACLDGDDESPLLSTTAISLFKMRLLPLATLAVAYLSEAERLAGTPVGNIDQMKEAAEAIRIYGPKTVLIKADRLVDGEMVDILYDGAEHQFLFTKTAPRGEPREKRDAFSSAVAAYLTKGYRVKEAIEAAKELLFAARLVGQAEPA
ncbi:MAG: bifunctional hydroxymethylpyrimidine kinase/phosphomethylpyrimidine kinase [Actinomycetota bacterium]|nr:bifunctional hydroxymethylpyrimidine kinase/phosphomethylpyrimidine kinase [Actinomycetota bacterium]